MSIQAENYASPEIHRIAEDAASVKAEVEGSPINFMFEPIVLPEISPIIIPPIQVPTIPPIEFPPIVVPPIPPIDVSSFETAKVTFDETGVAAVEMGDNVGASAGGFATLGKEAASATVSLVTVARGFTSVTSLGTGVISLAGDFGIVDKETAKYARTILAVITVISAMIRVKAYLTTITTGHTAAIAVEGATATASTGALTLSTVAHKIYAAVCSFATAAQNALNISHATFLALTGVGIGVIIAAAAAMTYFASQMNAATSGIKDFNAAAGETPTRARGIQRSGEESLYRRGVE
jgi:hypothetical protein